MTTFQQSDWTATIVAAGTSGTILKSPDPFSPCEGAGPPDYPVLTVFHLVRAIVATCLPPPPPETTTCRQYHHIPWSLNWGRLGIVLMSDIGSVSIVNSASARISWSEMVVSSSAYSCSGEGDTAWARKPSPFVAVAGRHDL